MIERVGSKVKARITFRDFEERRILITGASGLMGVNLAHTLANSSGGSNLSLISNSFPQYLLSATLSKATIYRRNLLEAGALRDLPSFDMVIHAATYAQPTKFMADPSTTVLLNTSTIFELFEKVKNGGNFVYLSSSEVYGTTLNEVFTEETPILFQQNNPRACYTTSKITGELIVRELSNQKGINGISFRLSSVYGPGVKRGDTRVMSQLIDQAITKNAINLLDDGFAYRTFCYIEDAIALMLNSIDKSTFPVLNVSGNSETTILDLAKSIGDRLDVPVFVAKNPDGIEGAPKKVLISSDKIKSVFENFSFTAFDSGLDETLKWHKEVLNEVD
jgi:nucleoside-diphosphate-sugar epimerase